MRYPIIADCRANFHESLNLMHRLGQVLLGDGKTKVLISGVGTIKCKVGENICPIEGVQYVPDLAESIYTLFFSYFFISNVLHMVCILPLMSVCMLYCQSICWLSPRK